MDNFQEYMQEYKKQLEVGVIQKAYKGLMEYMMGLKTYLKKKYPDYSVSSNLYLGYMDMTYFPITPMSLKNRHLKIALVFNYEQFRFEVWLGGYNKMAQMQTWEMFMESDWNKYHIVSSTKGVDSIVEYVLVENPDFSDLDSLTDMIEKKTILFIEDIEDFLSKQE